MRPICAGILIMVALVVTGCSKASYRSEPVVLMTELGDVTCQLYTRDRLDWDEAIAFPEGMNRAQADQLCLNEGQRILRQTYYAR